MKLLDDLQMARSWTNLPSLQIEVRLSTKPRFHVVVRRNLEALRSLTSCLARSEAQHYGTSSRSQIEQSIESRFTEVLEEFEVCFSLDCLLHVRCRRQCRKRLQHRSCQPPPQ